MSRLASQISKLRGIGRAADPAFDRRMLALLLGSLLAGAAELLSIGSVLPMLLLANGGRQVAFGSFTQAIDGDIRTWAILFALLVAITAALRMWLAQFSQRQVLEIGSAVAVAVHQRVLEQPYSYHVRHHSSALIAAIAKVDQLMFGVAWPLVQAIAAVIIGAAIMALLIGLQPGATFAASFAIGGIYLLISQILRRHLRSHGEAASKAHEQQVRHLQDSVAFVKRFVSRSSRSGSGR
ncbi:MAG: hypothetical protein ABI667_03215 [Sphingomicrobium sp.]